MRNAAAQVLLSHGHAQESMNTELATAALLTNARTQCSESKGNLADD